MSNDQNFNKPSNEPLVEAFTHRCKNSSSSDSREDKIVWYDQPNGDFWQEGELQGTKEPKMSKTDILAGFPEKIQVLVDWLLENGQDFKINFWGISIKNSDYSTFPMDLLGEKYVYNEKNNLLIIFFSDKELRHIRMLRHSQKLSTNISLSRFRG